MSPRPAVERVAVSEIESFAAAEAAAHQAGAVIPISQSRARAWATNPQAEPDDTALIVARLDGHCVGYLGLLPAQVRVDGQVEPMSWFSTFFVPEDRRDQAIGGLLLMRALSLGRSLGVTGPSDEAASTFQAVGFTPHQLGYRQLDMVRDRNYLGLPLRTVRRALQKADRSVPGPLDTAIGGCSRVSSSILLRALSAARRSALGVWDTTEIERLPPPGPDEERPGSESGGVGVQFVRDRALLEWMLSHPWSTTDRKAANPAYYFDDYRTESRHRIIEVRPGPHAAPAGWVVVWFDVVGDWRRLQVLDHSLDLDPAATAEALVTVALRGAIANRANQVFLPAEASSALRRLGPLGGLFAERQRVDYIRPHPSSALASRAGDVHIGYADGDSPYA